MSEEGEGNGEGGGGNVGGEQALPAERHAARSSTPPSDLAASPGAATR
ncbi:MAG: hypothetical protein U1F49_05235 [Rubrivivax sp.]